MKLLLKILVCCALFMTMSSAVPGCLPVWLVSVGGFQKSDQIHKEEGSYLKCFVMKMLCSLPVQSSL